MMNAAVNNGDDAPFDEAMRGMVARYGIVRVLLGALRQARPVRPPDALGLSAHLRRDIGLPPEVA